MKTTVHDSLTGRFVTKLRAMFDKSTVRVANKQFTKTELRYIYSAVDHYPTPHADVKMRAKLLAKIDGMLG